MEVNIASGYIVLDEEFKYKEYQFVVGSTYAIKRNKKKISLYGLGFQYAPRLIDYLRRRVMNFETSLRFAEVKATGRIIPDPDTGMCVTDEIEVIREVPLSEVLAMINHGINNVGVGNTGNFCKGDYNAGFHNVGFNNSGYYCSGSWNAGNSNTGSFNSGHWNYGDSNSGTHNVGSCNSGFYNSGDFNTGRSNIGMYNSGWYNVCNGSSGFFNTKDPKVYMFNKPTKYTRKQIEENYAEALEIVRTLNIRPSIWISADAMTMEEKAAHPEWEWTNGYLKQLDPKDEWKVAWFALSDDRKALVKSLPNFDPEVFKEITGIEV